MGLITTCADLVRRFFIFPDSVGSFLILSRICFSFSRLCLHVEGRFSSKTQKQSFNSCPLISQPSHLLFGYRDWFFFGSESLSSGVLPWNLGFENADLPLG